ncbi:hypothetical protein P3T76_004008 [Phytophthora citrophthora]|uniref:Uncharacterized protein n=1 Tax=Phytophthora citrophthora TaxID=4793 RepID=A0AAD9GTE0_9STRA|nr:hypothetical protein P3T76_004008 [Phytophthora citrophthora]
MALTRSQAAALAKAQVAADAAAQTNVHPAEDTALVPHINIAQSPVFELTPIATEHVMNLAQHFIAQTQVLAEEQAMFLYRQRGEADAQNAALMAVQASTASSVNQLTEQQRLITHQLSEALTATHSELANQFQRMQVLERERILQIEKYVNVKIDEALHEVQDIRREIVSQTDGVQQLLNEFKHAVANNQDSVVAHIRQVVEEKLATVHLDSCGLDATQVHRMVEDAVTAALAGSKVMFDVDFQRMRSEIHQEVKAKIDEPVRCLVKEITTQEVRQLESRLQNAVTTAQSELNLQMQRQADATSVLRDKLRKKQVRSKHQSEQVDPTKLKTSIREVLRSNPDLVGPGQIEHQTPTNGTEPKTFDQINATIERSVGAAASTIERSVGAAATTIGNAISGGMRGLSRPSSMRNHCNSSDSDDDVSMDEEDRQLEKRMQDAWRKTYLCGKSGNTDAANDRKNAQSDKEGEKSIIPPPRDVISKQLDLFSQTELPIEDVTTINRNFRYGAGFQSGVLFVVPPTGVLVRQHTHPTLSDQEALASVPPSPLHQMQSQGNELLQLRRVQSRNNEKRNTSVRPQIQSMEHHRKIQSPSPPRPRKVQYQSKPARSYPRPLNGQLQSKPARQIDIQQLVEGLQREVARRAELAARRYSVKK